LQIHGVCQSCGFAVRCCECGEIRQADGSWRKMRPAGRNISDTVCNACFGVYMEELAAFKMRRGVAA
jgi:hypothetical protein